MVWSLIKAMRPKQWVKNGAIFAALVFDEKLFIPDFFIRTLLGFFLLSLISGTVYIINDLVDIEKDKLHPKKKYRPIASGALNLQFAKTIAFILPIIILPLSFWLSVPFGGLITLYLVIQVAYSFWLKHVVIIDVMMIAAGFVIRVAAGVVLVEVTRFSPWLYVVTTLLSLFMGFGKRRQELILSQNGVKNTRAILEHYNLSYLDNMIMIVATSTVMAYALYTFSAPNLPSSHWMMLTIPFVIYGIFRYMYTLLVLNSGGDPSDTLVEDRPLQLTVVLWGLSVISILYFF